MRMKGGGGREGKELMMMEGGGGGEDIKMHGITLLEYKSNLTHQIENTFVVCFVILISKTFSL